MNLLTNPNYDDDQRRTFLLKSPTTLFSFHLLSSINWKPQHAWNMTSYNWHFLHVLHVLLLHLSFFYNIKRINCQNVTEEVFFVMFFGSKVFKSFESFLFKLWIKYGFKITWIWFRNPIQLLETEVTLQWSLCSGQPCDWCKPPPIHPTQPTIYQ